MGEAIRWNRLSVKWWCLSYLTVMGTDILSDWGMFLPLRIVKQRTCDSTPQAILMGIAKWEPVRPPKPTQWNRSWSTSRDIECSLDLGQEPVSTPRDNWDL